MTKEQLEMRINELEKELAALKGDVGDAYSYVEGIDQRRLLLEKELNELREQLSHLQE